MALRRALTEVKHKAGGARQSFSLELWRQTPEVVVGRWAAPEDNPYGLAAGSFSWGVWPLGADATWAAYRIHEADGRLKSYRFDAVAKNKATAEGVVEFWDLLLDAKVKPSQSTGTAGATQWIVAFEDADEVKAAIEAGELTDTEQSCIARFRHALEFDLDATLARVDREIADAEFHESERTRDLDA
ncbi:Hypothetical Protein FCC1311_006782 [Hondaea fermentalgiana]|uniref:Uncharacterized protein n=1 Tax=Hondaea fermentalgiana TaxID=2315210 RepID=A0A2R5G0D9_9STRA|nr:Hypothetical Protein FCC1311_006782 [Hondaea fermentalgiana]|eukprot:GBG24460.1 Hypothetical Protein FCC1311_006782 [Hondaea fermentalgiana]